MSGNLILDTLISFSAIAVLSLIGFALFRGRPPAVDEERASARLALDEPDFEPVAWLAGEGAMLAEGAGGDFALVTRLGDELVIRRFGPGGARADLDGEVLFIRAREIAGPKARFAAPGAAQWAVKIQPGGAK